MPRIYWRGPPKGEGSVDDVVSHHVDVVAALKKGATEIAIRAEQNLEVLPKHRTGESQIGIQWGKGYGEKAPLDYFVYLHDPRNKGAAQGIENGHWSHGYDRRRDETLGDSLGPIRNGRNGDGGSARWVEGLHPLGRAAEQAVLSKKVY